MPIQSSVQVCARHATVVAAFEAQARAHPGRDAILSHEARLTYGALEERSRALAVALSAGAGQGGRWGDPAASGALRGQGLDAPVAILAERRASLPVAMIACMRAGRAFAVYDLAYPQAHWLRLAAVLRPKTVLWAAGGAPSEAACTLARELGAPLIAVEDVPGHKGLLSPTDPDLTAYLLYTSGTTGMPKCIATSHRPLAHFIGWHERTFGFGPGDRFTMLSGLSYDAVLRDLFAPLSVGASLHIPDPSLMRVPGGIAAWLAEVGPTAVHLTPPMGRLILEGAEGISIPSIRYLFWGGDMLRADHVRRFAELAPKARHINFYGASETPQVVAWHDATGLADAPPETGAPIGTGAAGAWLAVVDGEGRPVPDGDEGEILVSMPYPAQGYVVDGQLRPFPPGRPYATGDRGRRLACGAILLLGRTDDQVKIRGVRIEPAEVAIALEADKDIAAAAVLALGPREDPWLEAFVVPRHAGVALDALRARLADRLPAAFVPSVLHRLDRLPLLPNGKLDRAALRRIADDERRHVRAASPLSPQEEQIARIFESILHRPVANASLSFADLGGDSLSFVQASFALEDALGPLPPAWHQLSICKLAQFGAAGQAPSAGSMRIDTANLIRSLALMAIVAFHAKLLKFGLGFTSGLFIVSGFLFASLQLHKADICKAGVRTLRFAGRLALMAFALGLVVVGLRFLGGKDPDLLQHLLIADFVDQRPGHYGARGVISPHIWYVHATIHIFMLVGAMLLIVGWLRPVRPPGPFAIALALFAAGMLLRILAPALFVEGWLSGTTEPQHAARLLPTTHLATVMLGAMVALADTPRRQSVTVACVIAHAALSALVMPGYAQLITLAAAAMLLWAPSVRLPHVLAVAAMMLSLNAMFVYMLHPVLIGALWRAGLTEPLAVAPLATIAALGAGMAWRSVEQRMRRRQRRARGAQQSPA